MQCSPSKVPLKAQQTLGLPVGWPEDAAVPRQWPLLVYCHQWQEPPPHDHLQQTPLYDTIQSCKGQLSE